MPTSSNGRLARARALVEDRSGAMFVMGIPMCFFMIGLLYFVIGLGEDLVLRERMQDAADAGALTAAVVHARGMNLIALLNQLMAALVGLLIMVRLLEAVLIAAIAVATALAWPTGGASLSIVPGSEAAREEAHTAFDELKEVIDPIVLAIHYLEVGIQYGMPVLAEGQTYAVVSKYEPVAAGGVVIPGSFPLPLKNGDWPFLCSKAGEAAGSLIMLPLKPLIPVDAVRNVISSGLGALSKSFSGQFCGHGGSGLSIPTELPSVPLGDETKFNKSLPPLASVEECTTPKNQNLGATLAVDSQGLPIKDDAAAAQHAEQRDLNTQRNREVCEKAAWEQAMSAMGPDGGPTTRKSNGGTCAYKWEDSPQSASSPPDNDCPRDCKRDGGACQQFHDKVDGAREACRPGANKNVVMYHYQRRDMQWVVELIPLPGCKEDLDACTFNIKFRTPQPGGHDVADQSAQPPCGSHPQGTIGPEYNAATYHDNGVYAEDEYLCSQPHTHVEPSELEAKHGRTLDQWRADFGIDERDSHWTAAYENVPVSEPEDPTADGAEGSRGNNAANGSRRSAPQRTERRLVFVGAWSAVTYMHSCEQQIDNLAKVEDHKELAEKATGAAIEKEQGSGGGCGQSDEVHLEMEDATEKNVLGGNAYQMRAIALRKAENSGAKSVVRNVPLRLRGGETESNNPLGAAGDALRYIFAAQAEYYFDTGYKAQEGLDQTVDARKEWTWHMAWKARMRRLRLAMDDDDDSTCSTGWSSHGTKPKQSKSGSGGAQGSGSSGQGSDASGSQASQCDSDIAADVGEGASSSIQDAAKIDLSSFLGSGGGGLNALQGVVPGAGGQSKGSSGGNSNGNSGATACGSVSTLREIESLVIH